MKYERNQIVSNLYATSKSANGGSLLTASEGNYEVYDLDKLKDEFCRIYRHDDRLKSCDAYYYDQKDHVVIEFKNTSYRNLKKYYDEIEIKMIDTHMLLSETFYKNKKNTDISKKISLLVVYSDALSHGNGVCGIGNVLNTMKPKRGDSKRNVSVPKFFADEAEFSKAVEDTKAKYEGCFYKEIRFIEKNAFKEDYVDTGYFGDLSEWSEMV